MLAKIYSRGMKEREFHISLKTQFTSIARPRTESAPAVLVENSNEITYVWPIVNLATINIVEEYVVAKPLTSSP